MNGIGLWEPSVMKLCVCFSKKMGVLEQELNAFSEALTDSDLSSSASSEQYFSLEDQQVNHLCLYQEYKLYYEW